MQLKSTPSNPGYTCAHCGDKYHVPPSDIRAGSKYCSRKCKGLAKSATRQMRACEVCGTPFRYQPSRSTRFCSQACMGVAYAKRVEVSCDWCGSSMSIQPNQRRDHNFCNMSCKSQWEHQRRRDEGFYPSKVDAICEECGKQVRIHPYRVGEFKYCSRVCSGIASMRNIATVSPTTIEAETYQALVTLGIKAIPQRRIGNYLVDAYVPQTRTIIEVQGDYFHCNPDVYPDGPRDARQRRAVEKDHRRRKWFRDHGYTVVELWERDIRQDGAEMCLRRALT